MLGRLTRTLPIPEEIQKNSSSVPLETPDEKPMSEDERLLLCGTVVVKLMVLEIEPALKRGKDMTPSQLQSTPKIRHCRLYLTPRFTIQTGSLFILDHFMNAYLR